MLIQQNAIIFILRSRAKSDILSASPQRYTKVTLDHTTLEPYAIIKYYVNNSIDNPLYELSMMVAICDVAKVYRRQLSNCCK